MNDIEYFAHSGISNSKIKDYEKSPLHFYEKHVIKTTEEPDKDCFRIGRAAHCLALEPDKFSERFIVLPDINRRTNAGKAEYTQLVQKAALQGADIVTQDELVAFKAMADRMLSKSISRFIFEHAEFEKPIIVKCPRTGLERKIKPDISIPPGVVAELPFGLLADYKTTQDASYDGFNKSIWNLKYDYQDAYYTDTWCINYGLNPDKEMPLFVFIPVEKSAPYDCNFIELSREDKRNTLDCVILPILDKIAESFNTNIWHGYDKLIKVSKKPAYINRNYKGI
jgi:exodeoxyribonuclease VIII